MADTAFWPWLAVAGVGALHGLNPATGWMLAAAWGVRSGDRAHALRALMPIAVGHVASIALVAGTVAFGLSMDRLAVQVLAAVLFVAVAVLHLCGRTPKAAHAPTGHAGLALWSFMMSTAHGAGLMLVPALIPLCTGDGPGREVTASGSLMLALAAVGIHTAAMLAVTGLIASGVCRGFDVGAGWLQRFMPPSAPAISLSTQSRSAAATSLRAP
ncbi:hypothetical protein M2282_002084 [Variovorax boronicumulans]|uniref:hypothetical protein n=1 Tax=Variovorax boronicumulans TaxID=436515 RepID=UPI002474E478|nr:hypothetical protein [Variovorax boronicumulans]MDH6166937.1 hypothetical protein [Variovorax boronicumulans]